MKERPILFSTPMVEAILEGRKTQTRRVIKGVDNCYYQSLVNHASGLHTFVDNQNFSPTEKDVKEVKCRYGKPGDLLWVRETFCPGYLDTYFLYKASDCLEDDYQKWKPSIHMPKEAARIWLKVVSVRVERLQDISDFDAQQEGIKFRYSEMFKENRYHDYLNPDSDWRDPKSSFESLWLSINGKDSWNKNPWVWVVEFERVER